MMMALLKPSTVWTINEPYPTILYQVLDFSSEL